MNNFEELAQQFNKISIYKDPNQSKDIQIDETEFYLHEHELKFFVYEFIASKVSMISRHNDAASRNRYCLSKLKILS